MIQIHIITGLLVIVTIFPPHIDGHGRLIEPPSRASAWRYGFNTPHNYNDHELFCGGFTTQWVKNGGKCGVCGDAWDSKPPRAHEYGGTYGQGVIVRNYNVGTIITIRVELTASHMGYFTFGVCQNYKNTTQECLDKNILKAIKPQKGEDKAATRFYPKDGNKVYEMRFKLPDTLNCPHCVLQWRYISGNNWGNCKNGTEAIGCGAQEEFRACADISISGKGPSYIPTSELPEEPTTITSITTPGLLPEPEETYNPVTAIIITVITFLVISLLLFLLYFHYYQVGRQVKVWVKRKPSNNIKESNVAVDSKLQFGLPPVAPPRSKRNLRVVTEDNMQEIDLRGDAMA